MERFVRITYPEFSHSLEKIWDAMEEGVLIIDRELNIVAMNRAAERMTGVYHGAARGRPCFELCGSGFCERVCSVKEMLQSGESCEDFDLVLQPKDGRRRVVRVHSVLLRGEDGEVIGAASIFRDVTSQREAEKIIGERKQFGKMVGQSAPMQRLYQLIEALGDTTVTVLIQGETGTGKELIAEAIHHYSRRADRPLVKINCAAVPESLLETELFGYQRGAFTDAYADKVGRFEMADGGTLFLDEVGDMPLSMQAKLLRVLETGEFERVGGTKTLRVDVRIVAATNKDLTQAVANGEFRRDLFYRLNVVPLHVPPLRERKEDIPLLVEHFIERLNQRYHRTVQGVTEEAMRTLMNYPFPGNVRELEYALEYSVVTSRKEWIDLPALPDAIRKSAQGLSPFASPKPDPPLIRVEDIENNGKRPETTGRERTPCRSKTVKSLTESELPDLIYDERARLIAALRATGWRIKAAASLLRIDRTTLWRKMQRYGLEKPTG